MAFAVNGSYDSPARLRERILSSSNLKSRDADDRPIGIMPDLGAIARGLGLG